MKSHFLVTYHLNELSQKDKMRLLRGLFGYSNKKSGKIYFQKGALEDVDGVRVGINCVLFSSEKFSEIKNFFRRFKIKIEVREVFLNDG